MEEMLLESSEMCLKSLKSCLNVSEGEDNILYADGVCFLYCIRTTDVLWMF